MVKVLVDIVHTGPGGVDPILSYELSTLSFFISNAGKMRLVWSFTIFRVVAYFRCLEKIANIVVA